MQREAAAAQADISYRLQNILTIKLASFLLMLPAVSLYFSDIEVQHQSLLYIIVLVTGLSVINNLLARVLYGFSLYKHSFIALFSARGIFIAAALMSGKNPQLILMFFLLSAFLQFVYMVCLLNKHKLNLGFRLNPAAMQNILSASLVMGTGMLFVWLYDRIDIILIGQILDTSQAGCYSIAYSIYKVPPLFSSILLVPLYTKLSRDYVKGIRSRDEIRKHAVILLLFSCIVIIIYLLFSENAVCLFPGNNYAGTGRILNLLITALPALLLNNLTGVALNAIGKQKDVMRANLTGLLLNLSINCSLLNSMGITAAALASVSTEYSVFLMQLISLRKAYGYNAGGGNKV